MSNFVPSTVTAPAHAALEGLTSLIDPATLSAEQLAAFDRHNDVLRYALVLMAETLASLRQVEAKVSHASDDVARRMADFARINKGE